MRITLNLATRPFFDLGPAIKRLRIAMGVLAGVSLLLLLGLHEVHQKAEAARAREHSLDGAIARIQNERQGYTALMQRPDNAALVAQVEMLDQLFGQKSFSWTLAMENLETVLPAGVQVTQIQPVRAKSGQITLQLRVLGPHDLSIDLVRNLEHSKRFLHPRIAGESAESSGASGPNQRLEPVSPSNRFEFDLLADYNPPSPEERAANRKAEKESPAAADDSGNPPPGTRPARRVAPHTPLGLPQNGRQPYIGPDSGPGNAAPGQAGVPNGGAR
jgi:type IV pilus assembly protein PilN